MGTLYLGHRIKKVASMVMKITTDSEQSFGARSWSRLCGGRLTARCPAGAAGRQRGAGAEGLVLAQDALQASLHRFVQLFLQLLLLGHGQLGLVIPHHLVDVRGALRAVEHQCPLLQHPLLGRAPHEAQLQGPCPPGIFPPGVGGHERPLVEAHLGVVVPWPPAQQDGLGAHGGRHVDVQVPSPGRVDRDDSLHVLQVAHEVLLPLAGGGGELQHQLAGRRYFPEGRGEETVRAGHTLPGAALGSGESRGSGVN